MTRVTYLTFDSLAEGIGASQVTAYAERLPRHGIEVELITFEKRAAEPSTYDRLRRAGVVWRPQPFGPRGSLGGASRVVHGAWLLRRSRVVHARSDLAAASALLARSQRWVWDVRSFWADQRVALGTLAPGSAEERALRLIERGAARRSGAIVTLTHAAVPTLVERHGPGVAAKATVISTCADLDRFRATPLPRGTTVRLLLSGTLNAYYDVPAMIAFAAVLAGRRPAVLRVLAPGTHQWEDLLVAARAEVGAVAPQDMPEHIALHHAGMAVCRLDAGVSLRAAAPTKVGEFLASGRPVVVNAGLGDIPDLVAAWDCGVVIAATDPASLTAAADELLRLLDDPATPQRCRSLAEHHFDLDRAVLELAEIYRRLDG
jgi:glycosyltransferase involved in cell wall biosynthesis